MTAHGRLTVVRDETSWLPVLRLSGCLRDRTWDALETVLWQVCDEGHPMIGLDLGEVHEMSRLGARLLFDSRKLFAARFQTLTITALSSAAILAMGM